MKRLQSTGVSTFAAKLRKANYLSISVMRLKLAELNWLKSTLPNPTYKAHCLPQFNIHKFDIDGKIMLSERRIYDYRGVRIRLESLKQLK